MSSYETHVSPKTGLVSHRIRFRYGGKNKPVTFVTKEAALSWKIVLDTHGPARALALLEVEKTPATTRTVADQVDHHIKHRTGIDKGTRRRYQNMADNRIRPHFKGLLLSDLSKDDVAAWVNGLEVAPKTIANYHGLLSSALSSAVDAGLIPSNPAYRMKLTRDDHEAVEMVFLTQDEFWNLRDRLDSFWHPLVMLLALTGMRWGEATALRVCDVDVAAQSANIRQAWKHTEGEGMRLGPPKSRRSRRTVAVPPHVLAEILPLMEGKKATEIIIRNRPGRPVRSGTFHGRVWQPMVKDFAADHGKKPRVHDLRHSYASWAIAAGVSLPVIQRQLGHESITTTIDRYGHLIRADFDPLLSLGERPVAKAPRAIGA